MLAHAHLTFHSPKNLELPYNKKFESSPNEYDYCVLGFVIETAATVLAVIDDHHISHIVGRHRYVFNKS
jgi:hypothetical protein